MKTLIDFAWRNYGFNLILIVCPTINYMYSNVVFNVYFPIAPNLSFRHDSIIKKSFSVHLQKTI